MQRHDIHLQFLVEILLVIFILANNAYLTASSSLKALNIYPLILLIPNLLFY
jgi:hypothetical protein